MSPLFLFSLACVSRPDHSLEDNLPPKSNGRPYEFTIEFERLQAFEGDSNSFDLNTVYKALSRNPDADYYIAVDDHGTGTKIRVPEKLVPDPIRTWVYTPSFSRVLNPLFMKAVRVLDDNLDGEITVEELSDEGYFVPNSQCLTQPLAVRFVYDPATQTVSVDHRPKELPLDLF